MNIEYDSSGYPLVNQQIHTLPSVFDTNKPFKIGKLRKYDDGSVEFVAEKSKKSFDILPTPPVNFRREFVTFDDEQRTVTLSVNNGSQYSTCLKFDA